MDSRRSGRPGHQAAGRGEGLAFLAIGHETAQDLQAGIDLGAGVIVRPAGELLATLDAQPGAVLPAQWRDRLGQPDRVAHLPFQLELVVIVQSKSVRFGFDVHRKAAREIDDWQRFFVDLDLDRPLQLAEATAANLLDGGR